MQRGGDVDYAAAGAFAFGGGEGAWGVVFLDGGEEVGEADFGDVVAAEEVDVDDGFHRVGGELGEGGEEVACCAGSGSIISMALVDDMWEGVWDAYIKKSIPPSSFTQWSTACCRESTLRTSMLPTPMTLAPERAVAMSFATEAVFSSLRPTMQALAPRCTSARTCAEQMLPLPPVQKTTLSAKMPSFQTSER